MSICEASQATLAGTIGCPTGVSVSWRRIVPIAWSCAARRVGEASVAYRMVISGVTCPSSAISACSDMPALARVVA